MECLSAGKKQQVPGLAAESRSKDQAPCLAGRAGHPGGPGGGECSKAQQSAARVMVSLCFLKADCSIVIKKTHRKK